MDITIRPLQADDRAQWEELWRGYQAFYHIELEQPITDMTWQRMLDPSEPVYGLCAATDTRLIAIAHYLLHRSTWLVENTCYLHDLYVAPDGRNQGTGEKLIQATYDAADALGATQVYWQTHQSNTAARRIYDKVAHNGGFIVYDRFG